MGGGTPPRDGDTDGSTDGAIYPPPNGAVYPPLPGARRSQKRCTPPRQRRRLWWGGVPPHSAGGALHLGRVKIFLHTPPGGVPEASLGRGGSPRGVCKKISLEVSTRCAATLPTVNAASPLCKLNSRYVAITSRYDVTTTATSPPLRAPRDVITTASRDVTTTATSTRWQLASRCAQRDITRRQRCSNDVTHQKRVAK